MKEKLLIKNASLVNFISFLIGLILIMIGCMISNQYERVDLVLLSTGCSILASSIIVYISSKYIIRETKAQEIILKWGLSSIYSTRAEMNKSSNEKLKKLTNNIDIVAFGLRSFRDSQTDIIKQKVQSGLKVRIITMNPNSVFLKQREIDEHEIEGQMKNTILDLITWINLLKNHSPSKSNVQIKFYNTLPQDFYFRVDDTIFIGPYLYGVTSQQTISFEYDKNSIGFSYWQKYFNSLWHDNQFSKQDYNDFKI